MSHRPFIMITLVATALAAGCTRQIVHAPNPLEIDAREYDRVYQAVQLVLRDEGFVLARQDHRFGVITTRPLPAPSAMEFWRGTHTTAHQQAQATLNTEQRVVTVMLEKVDPAVLKRLAPVDAQGEEPATVPDDVAPPADAPAGATGDDPEPAPAGAYVLRVEVLVQRQQLPLNHFTGSITPGRMQRALTAVPVEWQQRGIQSSYWQTIGRDPYLEQRLVAQIIRKSVGL